MAQFQTRPLGATAGLAVRTSQTGISRRTITATGINQQAFDGDDLQPQAQVTPRQCWLFTAALGATGADLRTTGNVCRRSFQAQLALAGRQTIAFKDVLALPLVLPPHPHPLRARLETLARQHDAALTVAAEADSIHLQHEIVAHGGGFAITAGQLSAPQRERLTTLHIVDPVLSRSVVLGTTLHRPSTHALREVSRLILDVAPAMLNS